jgi:FMN phosphatase YigB (HAD superfamily)
MKLQTVDRLFERIKKYDCWIFDIDNTIYDQCEYDKYIFETIELKLEGDFEVCGLSRYLMDKKILHGPLYDKLFNDAVEYFKLDESELVFMIDFYRSFLPPAEIKNSLVGRIRNEFDDRKLFAVTNGHKKIQRHKVNMLGLKPLFTDIVFCEKSSPETLKPNIWAWNEIRRNYDIKSAVMIGDSIDIDGGFANACGIDFYHFEYRL